MLFDSISKLFGSVNNLDTDEEKPPCGNPNGCISKDDLTVFKRSIQIDFLESMSRLAARVDILEENNKKITQYDQFYANAFQGEKDTEIKYPKRMEDSCSIVNKQKKENVPTSLIKAPSCASQLRRSSVTHRTPTQEDLDYQCDGDNVTPKLLPPDIFSLLASSKTLSQAFFLMLLVATVQFLMISFLIVNTMLVGRNNDPPNQLNVPVNVNTNLLVLQFLAIVITCFGQTDIRQSLEVLYYGYDKKAMEDAFSNNSFGKWLVSLFIRFSLGILSVTVTFILIVTEDNARDLLLNFTAMEFVSYLDDIAFLLSKWGYFGKTLKLEAVRVADGRYDIQTMKKTKNKGARSFARTSFLFFLFIIMIILWSIIVRKQRTGSYLCSSIYVQFGDEFSPELGTFTGQYDIASSKELFPSGRVEYREITKSISDAKFSYCDNDETWIFNYKDDSDYAHIGLPEKCKWNARSGVIEQSTSPSYDILSSRSWFTKNYLNAPVPMKHFTIECNTCIGNPDFCGDPERGKCNKVRSFAYLSQYYASKFDYIR